MVKTIKTASRGEGKTAKPDFVRWKYTPFTMKTLLYCKKGAKSPPKTKSSNFLTISRLRSKTLWPSPAPNLTV